MKAFLKWAGGKSRIAADIENYLKDGKRLVEPFVGSGAVFLNTSFEKYLLCDTNSDLINLYNNYNSLNVYIKVLHYILVTIYLLLIGTIKQIFSSRNI